MSSHSERLTSLAAACPTKPPLTLSAYPSDLSPSPLICECAAVLFCRASPLTSLICTMVKHTGRKGRRGGKTRRRWFPGVRRKRGADDASWIWKEDSDVDVGGESVKSNIDGSKTSDGRGKKLPDAPLSVATSTRLKPLLVTCKRFHTCNASSSSACSYSPSSKEKDSHPREPTTAVPCHAAMLWPQSNAQFGYHSLLEIDSLEKKQMHEASKEQPQKPLQLFMCARSLPDLEEQTKQSLKRCHLSHSLLEPK